MTQTQQQMHHDVELGRCSGFPECCIAHFVFIWMPKVDAQGGWRPDSDGVYRGRDPYVRAYTRAREMVTAELGAASLEYVPCPRCLLRRTFVEVQVCSRKRCGHPGM